MFCDIVFVLEKGLEFNGHINLLFLSLNIYNKCQVIGNFRQTIKCVIKMGIVVSTEVVKFMKLDFMVQVLKGGWLCMSYTNVINMH